MRLLLVKMSSMGDLVHTLPAVNDALDAQQGLEITWLIEEAFTDIAAAHPGISAVVPICFRRFRSNPLKYRAEFVAQIKHLRAQRFDKILDAQGLFKSAVISRLVGSKRSGLDFRSAREGLASIFYTERFSVLRDMHAVDRSRSLFAQALGYPIPEQPARFGLTLPSIKEAESGQGQKYGVFLHGTTWESKQWPEKFWRQLAGIATQAGYAVKVPAGDAFELARAKRIGDGIQSCQVLDKFPISALMRVCANAAFVVSVDTGLGHLAAALEVPVVSLFGPTKTALTGIRGAGALNLQVDFTCAPCMQRSCNYKVPVRIDDELIEPACFSSLAPDYVWQRLQSHLSKTASLC